MRKGERGEGRREKRERERERERDFSFSRLLLSVFQMLRGS
jgi:hypothetical protein